MRIAYSQHALRRLADRRILRTWIESALATADYEAPDPDDLRLTRAYKRIDEAEGRVLRVVYFLEADDTLVVVTAFFDPDADRLLKRWLSPNPHGKRRKRD